jgi:hypothetical protein
VRRSRQAGFSKVSCSRRAKAFRVFWGAKSLGLARTAIVGLCAKFHGNQLRFSCVSRGSKDVSGDRIYFLCAESFRRNVPTTGADRPLVI